MRQFAVFAAQFADFVVTLQLPVIYLSFFSLAYTTDLLRYQYAINTDKVRNESAMPPCCTRSVSKGEKGCYLEIV